MLSQEELLLMAKGDSEWAEIKDVARAARELIEAFNSGGFSDADAMAIEYLDVRARLAAHTEAAKLALEVLEDELGVRMESFSAKRQDGTYDRSVCDQQELADIESCEAAIKALTDAISAPDPPSTEPPDRAPEERVTVRRELLTQLQRGRHARAGMVAANLSEGIAFQIRATRDAQGITQAALAEATGMSQNNISRLENPEYGKHTVSSLKRIADALDVALVVRLVPFSQYIDWLSGRPYLDRGISVTALAVPEYAKDLGLKLRTPVVDGYSNGGYADSRCDCHTSRRSVFAGLPAGEFGLCSCPTCATNSASGKR